MPRPKRCVVRLSDEQRTSLWGLLRKGAHKARVLTQARILLLSAAGQTDAFIAEALKVPPDGAEHPQALG
jgi:hypothetical protein